MDNAFTERLWKSLKYEEVYINGYESVRDVKEGIARYINFYNLRNTTSITGLQNTCIRLFLLRKSKVVNGILNMAKYCPTNGAYPNLPLIEKKLKNI